MPNFALVLTAAPGSQVLRAAPLTVVLESAGATSGTWLGEDAWEIVADLDGEQQAKALRLRVAATLAHLPIDVNVVGADTGHRRKRILVADMESTIIQEELIDEIGCEAGLGERIAEITAQSMRGDIEFGPALRQRVELLRGLDANVLERAQDRITLSPGAQTLVHTMKKQGAYCALVSGGFSVFTGQVARLLGFDAHQANALEIENGRLTGRVLAPILDSEAKRGALLRFAREQNISIKETLAVGDGANDIDMVRAAGLGVGFRPKPVLAAAAQAAVQHGDLTALLYLQGYRHAEFVA